MLPEFRQALDSRLRELWWHKCTEDVLCSSCRGRLVALAACSARFRLMFGCSPWDANCCAGPPQLLELGLVDSTFRLDNPNAWQALLKNASLAACRAYEWLWFTDVRLWPTLQVTVYSLQG